jgi:hypothetical protein
MPAAPAPAATISMTRTLRAVSGASASRGSRAINANASVRRPSPARIAIASPAITWSVGCPRRSVSLSMAGRSSWINEYV